MAYIVPAATTSLSPRGGARHRTLKKSILSALAESGEKGLTVKQLADRLGVLKVRVQNWFSGTGRGVRRLEKIGTARWRLRPKKAK